MLLVVLLLTVTSYYASASECAVTEEPQLFRGKEKRAMAAHKG